MGIKRDFMDAHWDKVGYIEGGDGATVQLNYVTLTTFCAAEWAETFGCPAGTFAILVQYVPAELPDRIAPAFFPKTFDGTPVYYKRGTDIVAASGS